MDAAFLDKLPKEGKWVNDNGVPLNPEKGGTPLQAYLTMRQMKLMGIDYGDLGLKLKKVKMSGVANTKTILKLANDLAGKPGTPTSEQLMATYSAEYASTAIIQAGAKIIHASWENPFYQPPPAINATPKQLADAGLKPDAELPTLFDINFGVVPFGSDATVPNAIKDGS